MNWGIENPGTAQYWDLMTHNHNWNELGTPMTSSNYFSYWGGIGFTGMFALAPYDDGELGCLGTANGSWGNQTQANVSDCTGSNGPLLGILKPSITVFWNNVGQQSGAARWVQSGYAVGKFTTPTSVTSGDIICQDSANPATMINAGQNGHCDTYEIGKAYQNYNASSYFGIFVDIKKGDAALPRKATLHLSTAQLLSFNVAYALSAAANASAGVTQYTGTITQCSSANALVGAYVLVAGFSTGANNGGPWYVSACDSTHVTVANSAGTSETHAGTATVNGYKITSAPGASFSISPFQIFSRSTFNTTPFTSSVASFFTPDYIGMTSDFALSLDQAGGTTSSSNVTKIASGYAVTSFSTASTNVAMWIQLVDGSGLATPHLTLGDGSLDITLIYNVL